MLTKRSLCLNHLQLRRRSLQIANKKLKMIVRISDEKSHSIDVLVWMYFHTCIYPNIFSLRLITLNCKRFTHRNMNEKHKACLITHSMFYDFMGSFSTNIGSYYLQVHSHMPWQVNNLNLMWRIWLPYFHYVDVN